MTIARIAIPITTPTTPLMIAPVGVADPSGSESAAGFPPPPADLAFTVRNGGQYSACLEE